MSRRRTDLLFAILSALFVVLVSMTAHAQSIPSPPAGKPTAADEATAKKSFETGLKLYGEGAFAEALVSFEQSYKLGGRPSALKNMAQCHRNLKHFVEAYEAYDQMLTLHEAALPAGDKAAVKQAIEELSVLTGTLLVAVTEADAEIEVGGKSAGKSPMAKPKRVAVAAHTVKVTKPNFAPFESTVNVGSQEAKKLDVKLEVEKRTGRLVVREQGARDVHIFIDGEDKGPAPFDGELSAGEHKVEAKSARFVAEARKIQIVAKERMDVVLDAQPLTGHLRITTVPATATIAVDNNIVGTGSWDGDLPEGSHRVEVTLGGQPSQVRDIVVTRGQSIVQEIPLLGALAGGHVTDYRGVYVKWTLHVGYTASGLSSNSVQGITRDEGGFLIAPGSSVRVGYAFDWYAAELVGTFMFEHRDKQVGYDVSDNFGNGSRRLRDDTNGGNLFIGVGGRVTSKAEYVRFTFGLAPGFAVRSYLTRRNPNDNGGGPNPSSSNNRFQGTVDASSSGNIDENFGNAGYTAFALSMDGGIIIGSTPGTKFTLGLNAWIDFPPSDVIVGPDTKTTALPDSAFRAPGRGIYVVEGTQFFVGPSLGLQFGH